MFGKTFNATGSSTSMKGTTRKMMKGTSLKTSAVVRVSCFLSRLQKQPGMLCCHPACVPLMCANTVSTAVSASMKHQVLE